jgi:hypothetical protein
MPEYIGRFNSNQEREIGRGFLYSILPPEQESPLLHDW